MKTNPSLEEALRSVSAKGFITPRSENNPMLQVFIDEKTGRPYRVRQRISRSSGLPIIERRYGSLYLCKCCKKTLFTTRTKRIITEMCPVCFNHGEIHPLWKGGRLFREGYWLRWMPSHPYADKKGYVKEHRYLIEKKLGRYLLPTEVVHHENKDKGDNRMENLRLFFNHSEHIKYHVACGDVLNKKSKV